MPTLSIGDADIHHEIHGSGEPVLLVAGLGGAASYWAPNLPAFAGRYRTILHDHRGTGGSTRSRIAYSIEQMADDLLRLMDALQIESAHLVGHSTGGAIGQVIAIEHPERLRSMVLYASWDRSDPFLRRVMAARRALVLDSGPAAYLASTPLFLYPDGWINENDGLLREREKNGLAGFPGPEIAASRIDAVLAFDRTADLHRIKTPTLVLCAEDDFLTPPYMSQALADAIPGARSERLERGGHACSEVAPREFDQRVFAFIDDCVARRKG
jgi:aminoacrylate hydrolase